MSRIERLVNLTAALLNAERPVTAEQLREWVPGYPDDKASFRRQFERDKEALREFGFPLVTVGETPHSPARYSVDRDRYYLRDPGLSPDELSALSMAAEVVRFNGLGDKRIYDAMWKLEGAASKPNRSEQARGASRAPLEAELPADASLAPIFDAIASDRGISFHYRDELRRVAPRSLSFENGRWYLSAYDLDKREDRSFRVDRIDGPIEPFEVPESTVVPPPVLRASPTRRPWELGTGEPVVTRVRIDAAHAPWAERHVGADAVVARDSHGAIEVNLAVRNRAALHSFVLGFLDGAEILAPPESRQAIVDWLQAKAGAGAVAER
jgi:proteasome accessory factor B